MNDERGKKGGWGGLTRREFLTSVGLGAAGAAAGRAEGQPKEEATLAAGELARIRLTVNGRDHTLLVEPRESLLNVLRERIGLTATKPGCERGECGACTVLVDGMPRYSCLTLAVEAEGRAVTTLEGLMDGEALGATQAAFLEEDAFQCGYCTPGQVMAVDGLLRENPSPTEDEIRRGVSGNLCRCGAYPHIFAAARRAAGKGRG